MKLDVSASDILGNDEPFVAQALIDTQISTNNILNLLVMQSYRQFNRQFAWTLIKTLDPLATTKF